MRPLILASTSPYRQQLLARLGLPFATVDPALSEALLPDEHPDAAALRLAEAKARAAAERHPHALIIGSDQVASVDGCVYGKPGTHQRAVAQLRQLRGRRVRFFTGVCLLDTDNDQAQVCGVPTTVTFREVDDDEIEAYLRREQPYNCAGSARAEGLGIAVISRIEGDDPTALIGLPLIKLCELLRNAGVAVI